MKATEWLVLLLVLIPAATQGTTMELLYGWDAGEVLYGATNGFDFLGVAGGDYKGKSLGTFCETRVLPAGYEVAGYRIVREEWEDLAGEYRPGVETPDGLTEDLGSEGGGLRLVASAGLMGYEVLVSVVEPVRVVDGKAAVLKDMLVEVDLRPAGERLEIRRRSLTAEAHVRGALAAFLGEEPPEGGGWELQRHAGPVTAQPSLKGSAVDCVIVTPDSLRAEFERLAAWHDKLGIKTVVRTMEWVRARYAGGDGAERLRNFIRDAYTNWGTVYVLLGGDPHLVPIRVVEVPDMVGEVGRSDMPTDVYYTNLDGNWNADYDGTVGEYLHGNPDQVDILPDAFVGRAPVASAAEARVFVKKTMVYGSGLKPGQWQETAVMLAQVLWPDTDGAAYAEDILPHLPDNFTIHRLYQNYDAYPGAVEETVANLLSYVNGGCNVLGHIGHGDELRLDLGTEFMERFQLEALANDSMFCFVFMMNCSASDPRVESVAKTFIKDPDGGAFAVMGNSSLSYPYTGKSMQIDFYNLAFAENPLSVGAASALFRPRYAGTSKTAWWMYLNYILSGDPVIKIRENEARPLDVTFGALSLSDSVYSVEVLDGGMGVEGATVVLIGDRGEYGVGVTGSDGIAAVSYRPLGLGYVDVVASHRGYLMHEDSVAVTGSGGRLYVSGVSVDDGLGWDGNDDGMAGWGERVGLGVGLTNGDVGTLDGVACDLGAVAGCSLYVSVEFDSISSDSVIHVGRDCLHPGGMAFGLGVSEEVFGRCYGLAGHDAGCWVWLDGDGWHVRYLGDGEGHSYRCSVSVYGELLGFGGHELEPGDSLTLDGGLLVLSGTLGVNDFTDGLDLGVGSGWDVVVHDGTEAYGSVGGSEVLGWYDVEFMSIGEGDGLGVWFEASLSDGGGGSWRDWFRVDVLDGELLGERLEFTALGGDTTGVLYGVRNTGGGGLRNVVGVLRGISGVEVCDSVVVYGDICGGCYASGSTYRVRETGGPVLYDYEWTDHYGRTWRDTVEVRVVGAASGLAYRLVFEDLELYWTPSSDSMLSGYDVYRSDTYGGPYELAGLVEGYSRYEDDGLASEESYYYYVCARDSMGNVSAPSETLEAWTGPPAMPGWPAELRGAALSSPVAGDASHNGSKEVFLGSKGLEVTGIDVNGQTLAGFPYEGDCEVWTSPALADLDGDGTLECIAGEGKGNKGAACARVLVFNHDGTHMNSTHNPLLEPGSPGWPQEVAALIRSVPAIGDLDRDGRPEIVIGTESVPGRLYAFRYDGSPYIEGSPVFAETECQIWAAPCLVDLDDDGMLEVVVCDMACGSDGGNLYIWNHDGSPYIEGTGGIVDARGSSYWSSPAIGDIDNDGSPEIVAVDTRGRVLAWNHDGSPIVGDSPIIADTGLNTWSSPALADFDGDGTLEIAVGFGHNHGSFLLVRYDGTPYATEAVILEWDRALGFSAPAVADIDADGDLEIVTCSLDGFVMGLETDGSFAPGYPIKIDGFIYASPLVEDIDGDGDLDLLVPAYDSRLYAWDLGAPSSPELAPWPMLHHDRWRTGVFGFQAPADTAPPTYSIAVFQNPLLERVMDFYVVPGEQTEGAPQLVLGSAGLRDTLESELVPNTAGIYRGHHLAGISGAETLYVSATDLYGNLGTDFRVITYSRIVDGEVVVTSADGGFTAYGPATGEAVLACLPVDSDYLADGPHVPVDVRPAAYNLCIVGGRGTPLSVRAKTDRADELLYMFDGGWKPVEGQDKADGYLVVHNASPGIYGIGTGLPGRIGRLTISPGLPNPFGETCAFVLNVPQQRPVRMCVYDVRGRLVDVLFDGHADGPTEIVWDGRNSSGRRVSSGIYFVRARSGSMVDAIKVIMVR